MHSFHSEHAELSLIPQTGFLTFGLAILYFCSSVLFKNKDTVSQRGMQNANEYAFGKVRHNSRIESWLGWRERSGSVVECLTRDRRGAGSSLTAVSVVVLEQDTFILAYYRSTQEDPSLHN